MAKNVAQFMLERLSEWGIKRIYGYPSDGPSSGFSYRETEELHAANIYC